MSVKSRKTKKTSNTSGLFDTILKLGSLYLILGFISFIIIMIVLFSVASFFIKLTKNESEAIDRRYEEHRNNINNNRIQITQPTLNPNFFSPSVTVR